MKKGKMIFNKLKAFFKDRWNLTIMILALLAIILGVIVVGTIKTAIVIGLVVGLVIIAKYGGAILMGKKKIQTKPKKEEKPKKKKTISKVFNVAIMSVFLVGIIAVIGGICFMGYIVMSAPKFDTKKLSYKEASIVYDKNGKEIMRMGKELRDKVTYDEIPQVFIDAIIATEDSRFFVHNGFDLPRFLKASFGQALGNSGAGGASTITMQVIKNNFTSTNQSITRKFTDIYLSIFKIEKQYTKEQILEFYVNNIHLGVNNTLGIAEAARGLFNKEIGDINLSEAALLAGMFQAPGAYNPYKYPEKAAARRSTVLYLMEKHGYITSEERKIANSMPIESLVVNQEVSQHPYQAYIDMVSDEIIKKTGYDPMEVSMKIYTNLDPTKQDYLNKILDGSLFKFENDVVQAGIAVTDVHTGAILAIGNGRNRAGQKLFNLAVDAKRQVGSTAKPLFDYGPGMEFNNWSTYTPFLDDEYTYSGGKPINDWDGKYNGLLTLRYALTQSRNIPALKAFQQVDNKKIISFVESLGITPEVEDGKIHEAHAIGGFNGASPLQLAAAYAAFANGGYYMAPYTVNKIELMDSGESKTFKAEKVRVMSDSTAYMITNVLKFGVDNKIIGGGKVNGIEVAAKSGTSNFDQATKERYHLASNAINDLWYAGYSPDISIGMWYGYEKISSQYYSKTPSSSGVRDKLFTAIAKGIFENNGHTFTIPNSVVKVDVEKGTIPVMLPSKYTPSNMITSEYFKKGTEPTEVSPRFNTLSNVTGLDAKKSVSSVVISWNAANVTNDITEDYISTVSDHKDKYIAARKNEDSNLLGALGYNVYLKQADGHLLLLEWTSNTHLTHTPSTSGSLTYVVKTCYSNFKSSESDGAQVTLSDSPYIPIVDIYLAGDETMNITQGSTFTDPGVTVLDNMVNVTSDATISTVITKGTDNTVVDSIDTSIKVTYKITYTINYKDETETLVRTVNII